MRGAAGRQESTLAGSPCPKNLLWAPSPAEGAGGFQERPRSFFCLCFPARSTPPCRKQQQKKKKKKHFLKDVSRWCLSCEVLLVPGRPGCSVGVAQVPSGCKSGFLVPLLLWVGASPRVRLPQATSEPTEPRSLLTTKVLVEITVPGRQMKYSPFFSLAGLHEWQVSVWN